MPRTSLLRFQIFLDSGPHAMAGIPAGASPACRRWLQKLWAKLLCSPRTRSCAGSSASGAGHAMRADSSFRAAARNGGLSASAYTTLNARRLGTWPCRCRYSGSQRKYASRFAAIAARPLADGRRPPWAASTAASYRDFFSPASAAPPAKESLSARAATTGPRLRL